MLSEHVCFPVSDRAEFSDKRGILRENTYV